MDFQTALSNFLDAMQQDINAHHERNLPLSTPPTYKAMPGRKFMRIVVEERTGGMSACGFVEVATGDIYKAAGWAGPAKNFTRGNVFFKSLSSDRAAQWRYGIS
jgi:hypothetical protein